MENLEQLIGKLKEQFEQKAPPAQMLTTIKYIEAALVARLAPPSLERRSSKVSVVMPTAIPFFPIEALQAAVGTLAEAGLPYAVPVPTLTVDDPPAEREWILDPLVDIPTLSQQPSSRELNDVIGARGTTLNDRLKGEVVELVAALKDSPVRELKKAIGVNDRYVFINELFRGDEPMYERSIKTINNFRILAEAEYWMERELKIKLGWDDSREITQHFYQLVKRRFS